MELLYIIVPFYNSEHTLERTLRSVECIGSENRQRVRLIGVDDGSEDRSAEIFEKSAVFLAGVERELLRQNNKGSGAARNHALRSFDRGWTLFLDADDELLIDPFPFLDEAEGNSSVVFASEVYKGGKYLRKIVAAVIKRGDVPLLFTARNPLTTVSLIFRRELVGNLFDEKLRYLEDWHFWAVNADLFSAVKSYGNVVLGRIHIGRQNKTADHFNNGRFRIMAAAKIGEFWGERADQKAVNNLHLQADIGRIQMGKGRRWSALIRLPVTFSLYMKFLVYFFLFPFYRRFGWYT